MSRKYEPRHLAVRPASPVMRRGATALAPAGLAVGVLALAPTAGAAETGVDTDLGSVVAASVAAPAAVTAGGDSDVLISPAAGGEVSDPEPSDPQPVDPGSPEPEPEDPATTPPTPGPEPEDPSTSQPTPPGDGGAGSQTPTPGEGSTDGEAGGGQGKPSEPGRPLEPGTPVNPDTTPVTPVDAGSYTAGEAAPRGTTWVVRDSARPGMYRAVASYQPGAQLAQTGANGLLAVVGGLMVTGGAGLVAASRRRA